MENKMVANVVETKVEKKTKFFTKANIMAIITCSLYMIACFAFCDGGGTGGEGGAGGAGTIGDGALSSLLDIIGQIARFAGIGVAGLGIFKFALAIKDENGPGQSQAVLYIAAGAILIGLKGAMGFLVGL